MLLFAPAAHALDVAPLWNFSDPAASERAFRDALARTPPDGDDALVLQTQLARTLGLRGRFAEAHALLDAIEPHLASAGAEPGVRHRLERGRTFRSAKEPARARPLFEAAAAQAHAAGLDALEIDALHMIELVEPGTDAQLAWNRRALAIARSSREPEAQRWEASLSNNVGWTLARLQAVEREAVAADDADGYVAEEIAENLLASGRAEEARPWFARAHTRLSADHSPDRADDAHLARLAALARAP